MSELKIAALDQEDLSIVSAHVQDAVAKVGDLMWQPAQKRFVMAMNRFAWERKPRFFWQRHERRRSVLHFDRVLSARRTGMGTLRDDQVLSLLALRFIEGEAPGGEIELTFSGGAAVRLQVECIEARLTDLGGAWSATSRPRHAV
jgi:hypothetical protein